MDDLSSLIFLREKWVAKEEKVRRAIKQVLKCDVTQANPLAPTMVPQASCLLSLLCLEAACKDLPTFRSALKNISSLVKPGGHFILMTSLEDTFYMVGQHRFFCLYLTQEIIEDAVREAGFDIVWVEAIRLEFPPGTTDNKGVCVLVGQKRGKE